ncbi:MAG: hypothetical protein ACI8RZ_003863 [Myxococcota bacterium]|jgi:hypothetical protein
MLILLLSCSSHQPTTTQRPLAADMAAHSLAAQTAREAIIVGDLDAANAAGQQVADRWPLEHLPDTARVDEVVLVQNAQALAEASSIEGAAAAFGRMSVACGSCHAAQGASPSLPAPAPPPQSEAINEQMQRYHWAAERMWQGLVLPSQDALDEARAALAGSTAFSPEWSLDTLHLPADVLAAALSDIGSSPGTNPGSDYGMLLMTCAACHYYSPGGPKVEEQDRAPQR